ncbi:MAG: zf-HC2 domain-containing protein [Desulfatitalea sp.]|nr:zf-HC2 domain-containing protein [Desulfatitalea sp.]
MSEHTPHNHPDFRCRELFARMSEYLDNELDGSLCREIEGHLNECQACKVCLSTLKRTVALCREAGAAPIPETLSRRLRELIATLAKP